MKELDFKSVQVYMDEVRRNLKKICVVQIKYIEKERNYHFNGNLKRVNVQYNRFGCKYYQGNDSKELDLFSETDFEITFEDFDQDKMYIDVIEIPKNVHLIFKNTKLNNLDCELVHSVKLIDCEIREIRLKSTERPEIDDASKYHVKEIYPPPLNDSIFTYPNIDFEKAKFCIKSEVICDFFRKNKLIVRRKKIDNTTPIREYEKILTNFYEKLRIAEQISAESMTEKYLMILSKLNNERSIMQKLGIQNEWASFLTKVKSYKFDHPQLLPFLNPSLKRIKDKSDIIFLFYRRLALYRFIYEQCLEEDEEIEEKFNIKTIFEPVPFEIILD
jgi:hypothetical protein